MDGFSLTLERVFDQPVEAVYRAWTDPAQLARWVGHVEQADTRPGGSYRFANDDGEGGVFIHEGEYLELVPPEKIVMSFRAAQVSEADNPYKNETIAITLHPLEGGRTRLTFINRWEGEPMDAEGIAATKDGWDAWLDLLAEALN